MVENPSADERDFHELLNPDSFHDYPNCVFDFFAGTVERAPTWWQEHGLEWLYRLIKEPKRMWRRYIIGNSLFLWNMTKE